MSIDPHPLAHLGWDEILATALAAAPECRPGRVSRVDRGACTLLTAAGERRVIAPARVHASVPCGVAAGDWLALDGDEIAFVLPRRSALLRHAPGGVTSEQAVAANIDVILVTMALDSRPRPRKLERMLAAAWSSGAQPVVLLTKADLSADTEDALETARQSSAGVPVIAVSARSGAGLAELAAEVAPRRTLVLLGSSGSGKSTLVNLLSGGERTAVGTVRGDGKGRHTTTHRELFILPGGAIVIDTPGIRELGLWDADDAIATAYADIVELAALCRFSDCAHDSEPACAVRAAIQLDPALAGRLEGHRRLEREQRRLERRQDGRARAEAHRAIRARSRDIRRQFVR